MAKKTPAPRRAEHAEAGSEVPSVSPAGGDDERSAPKRSRHNLESLSEFARHLLQDAFLEHLCDFFDQWGVYRGDLMPDSAREPAHKTEPDKRKPDVARLMVAVTNSWHARIRESPQVVPSVRDELLQWKVDDKNFPRLLSWLQSERMLSLNARRVGTLASKVRTQILPDVRDVDITVVGDRHFPEAAAAEFVTLLAAMAREVRRSNKQSLDIGLVSGSTVEAVISAAESVRSWNDTYGVDPKEFPDIRVFALNVSLTTWESLHLNATILADRLAKTINRQTGDALKAKPFGLTAPLIVKRHAQHEYDTAPQTREVIEVTQPARLNRASPDQRGDDPSTELDLVLTSVGEAPKKESGKGSMFARLSEQFETIYHVDIYRIASEYSMQGDIVYTPVRFNGEEIPIKAEDGKGEELFFYSAIELPVLKHMVSLRPKKSVMLVARNDPHKDKVPAIKAALYRDHLYASSLVLDESTANNLGR